MPADPPELVSIATALRHFAFPDGKTQSSDHIKRLHWYTACRLVLEGGFHPDDVTPRPPFRVERRGGGLYLHHVPDEARPGECTILGGLKTKQVDVTVTLPGIGPVVAVSLKGTHNATRNLTNRMEEAAGDCTNVHMAYPALVYGFWHVLRANEELDPAPQAHFSLADDGRYKAADLTVLATGDLAEGVSRYAHALERLSERDDLRDHPARYEACGLTLASCRGGASRCSVYSLYPTAAHLLSYGRMFGRLYAKYDERFVYQAPALRGRTSRNEWDPSSPVITDTIRDNDAFAEMSPRTT
ncbi:MAG: hypothetical protein H6700_11015 [Myxococcales bacterium]|nr:hypothetical protein [Myxococcales bacterium]MCB9532286.1 hypothetical protein [Myxococcales bacterium]